MAEDRMKRAREVYEKTTGKKYEKKAYQSWANSPAGQQAWRDRDKTPEKPSLAKASKDAKEEKSSSGAKTYRKPDGSTYSQYGGPRSRQDVEVTTAPKKPEPSPSPEPSPAPKTNGKTADDAATALSRPVRGGKGKPWTGEDEARRKALAEADAAAARERYQGKPAEDIHEPGSGLAGATAAEKKRREAAAAARTAGDKGGKDE